VFLCGDAEAIPLERMAAVIAAELGHRLRAVRIPAGPFFVAADLCEAVCRPLGIPPPLYRRRVAFYTKDRSFDTRKIREKLGYRNRVPPEEGLRATARWYREHAWL
jgi:nucleoside-diphosphate-sugar epimerase